MTGMSRVRPGVEPMSPVGPVQVVVYGGTGEQVLQPVKAPLH
ncbi:hypothetical protein [Streptomyces echinatus]